MLEQDVDITLKAFSVITSYLPLLHMSWQTLTKHGLIMATWPNLAKLGLAEGDCCREWTSWEDVHAAASACRSIPIPRHRFWSSEFPAVPVHFLQNLETTGSRDLQRASSQMNIRRPSARDLAVFGMTDVASLHSYHKYIGCFYQILAWIPKLDDMDHFKFTFQIVRVDLEQQGSISGSHSQHSQVIDSFWRSNINWPSGLQLKGVDFLEKRTFLKDIGEEVG